MQIIKVNRSFFPKVIVNFNPLSAVSAGEDQILLEPSPEPHEQLTTR